VALGLPGGELHTAEGECRGEISSVERGWGGFGYDPIFLIPSLRRTMAELDMEEKNKISHRANALRNAEVAIRELLGL